MGHYGQSQTPGQGQDKLTLPHREQGRRSHYCYGLQYLLGLLGLLDLKDENPINVKHQTYPLHLLLLSYPLLLSPTHKKHLTQ